MTTTITTDFIEDMLKSWQRSQLDTHSLEALEAFNACPGNSAQEKLVHFRSLIYGWVCEPLPVDFASRGTNKRQLLEALTHIIRDGNHTTQDHALLYCRYISEHGCSPAELAKAASMTERSLRRHILAALEKIAARLLAEETRLSRQAYASAISSALPTFNGEYMVGIEAALGNLATWLEETDSAPIISIEGIGGIGKTSIAANLVLKMQAQTTFENFAWISARQQEFAPTGELKEIHNHATSHDDIITRLAHQLGQNQLAGLPPSEKLNGLAKLLARTRTLVVVDNLETLQDVDALIPSLAQLSGHSRIVVTSRHTLNAHANVRIFAVPELSAGDSARLVRNELQRQSDNLPVSDATVKTLFDVTGGVPLALKLAAAQFAYFPASEVIEGLKASRDAAQNLFTYIYRRAWMLLDDAGKELLLSMLLVSPEGEDKDWIMSMSDLSDGDFANGIRQLKNLSLIERSGTVEAPRYRIHRLTSTFLATDILKHWGDEPAE